MTKIIMVPGASNHPSDGLGRHVYEISKRLASKGIEVINIKPSTDNFFHIQSIESTYKLVEIPVILNPNNAPIAKLNKSLNTALYYYAYKESVNRFIQTIDEPSIIHTHGFYISSQPKKSSKFKRLSTLHGSEPLDMVVKGQSFTKATLLNGVLKHLYSTNADRWTALSKRVSSIATTFYDIDPNYITVVPHGVDCHFFSKSVSNEEIECINKKFALNKPCKILYLGQLDRNKKIDVLLNALLLLKDKKSELQLILRSNWGDYYFEALQLIKHLQLEDMVALIPQRVYGPELRALYHASDVFVNISTNVTGYSTALIEAMASGIPPIISKGSNEDVVDPSTGIIINDLSPKCVADSIRMLIENKKRAKHIGQNAQTKMINKFDWDNVVVPSYISVYKKMLNTI